MAPRLSRPRRERKRPKKKAAIAKAVRPLADLEPGPTVEVVRKRRRKSSREEDEAPE